MPHRIGVLSDTHGLLRPEALDALRGSERILHAGDVGDPDILDRLTRIAPVHAVRGNVDRSGRCAELPETLAVEVGGISVWMLHDVAQLDLDPADAGFAVVVHGHSHRPKIERTAAGVLFLNPGSAGPRRFRLPVALGELLIDGGRAEARIRPLLDEEGRR